MVHQVTGDHFADRLGRTRSWDFDAAVVVLLWPIDLSVARAVEFTVDQARERSRWRSHVNGAVMIPNRSTMDAGVDVTDRLSAAAMVDHTNQV